MRLRTKMLMTLGVFSAFVCLIIVGFAFLLFHRTPGQYFESNGAAIYYTDEGAGEPVILVHGLAATADLNWRIPGVVRALAKHFRVITFDLRGHGLSDKPTDPEQYGMLMIEDIILLMDHLDIERAHLAGYSLGGFLVLKAATLYPERIKSGAVCAAGWIDPDNPVPIPNPYRPPVRTAPVETVQASMPIFAASKSVFHGIRNRVGDYILDHNVKKAMKQQFDDMAVSKSALLACDVPILCVIGTKDGFLYLARDLAAEKPDIEYREIGNAGHFSLPMKKQFREQLTAFFIEHADQK